MNLSFYTSEVIGFDSTYDSNKEVFIRDTGTDTMDNKMEVTDKLICTTERLDVSVSINTLSYSFLWKCISKFLGPSLASCTN